ncbi:hypothetical protein Tco_1349644, partial [Tanacetum coccineum]
EMEDLDMTIEEYVQYETEKAFRNGKVYNWETVTYGFSSEPTVSPQHIDEINFKNEKSLSKYDDEKYNVISYRDENPIRTLRDYSRASHEGYRNAIELPDGNNVVPLRSDTIWLVQNGCSFHGLWPKDPNQHLKDFLKLVDSLDIDVANRERTPLHLF